MANKECNGTCNISASWVDPNREGGCCFCSERRFKVLMFTSAKRSGLLVRICWSCFKELRLVANRK